MLFFTDPTKFYYVMSHLEAAVAAEVEDIIVTPPATEKYEKLKLELIKRLSASKEKKVNQLLVHEELGDRKPSQLLRHLMHLAGSEFSEEFLKIIWLSHLSVSIQTIMASQLTSSLDMLADLADKVNDIVPQYQTSAVLSTPSMSAMDKLQI